MSIHRDRIRGFISSLLIAVVMAASLCCKAHLTRSNLKDVQLSPNFPGEALTIWSDVKGKIHLGNCHDCPNSRDAADPIDRLDYEIKVRAAVTSMRTSETKDFSPELKKAQEKLRGMREKLKSTGPNTLNAEERKAFELQIAVLEQALGLTEEEKKLIKEIFDYLDAKETITYYEGERRFALAKAPFGKLTNSKRQLTDEVSGGWHPFANEKGTPPSERYGHSAVMIGHKMIIWGGIGSDESHKNDGAIFDFDTSTWTPLPKTDAPRRRNHTAVVMGRKMIIWGGVDTTHAKSDGWIFDLDTRLWSPTSPAPFACHGHSAVVKGNKMIVWGRKGLQTSEVRTLSYDLGANTWEEWPYTSLAPPVIGQSAIYLDKGEGSMIIWGGRSFRSAYNESFYHLNIDKYSWSVWSHSDPVEGRSDHTAVLVGSKMIVWGGVSNEKDTSSSLLVYDFSVNSWSQLMEGTQTPPMRSSHSAVAFDNKMVIWGGTDQPPAAKSDGWIYELPKNWKNN